MQSPVTRPGRRLRTPVAVSRQLVLLLVAGLLTGLLVSCGSGSDDPAPAGPVDSPTDSTGATPTDPPTTGGPAEGDPRCEPGADHEVEELPDVTVPEVVVPPVTDPATGDELAPGFTVPAQVVDAGCVVRYDAPGGCLGAVTITGVVVPPVVIPEQVAGDRVYPAVSVPGATRPAVSTGEVCQVKRDGRALTTTRAGVVREGFSRPGAARPGDDLAPTVRIEPVRVPDVDVDPARLERRELGGGVGVVNDDDTTSYVAPAAVLFATDQATLRPEALDALGVIADRIRGQGGYESIIVEGHTDDRGPADYGMQLSVRRAEAVAAWLVDHGFAPDKIRTRGFGETKPAYPNNSDANRQRNRRVVITVHQ